MAAASPTSIASEALQRNTQLYQIETKTGPRPLPTLLCAFKSLSEAYWVEIRPRSSSRRRRLPNIATTDHPISSQGAFLSQDVRLLPYSFSLALALVNAEASGLSIDAEPILDWLACPGFDRRLQSYTRRHSCKAER